MLACKASLVGSVSQTQLTSCPLDGSFPIYLCCIMGTLHWRGQKIIPILAIAIDNSVQLDMSLFRRKIECIGLGLTEISVHLYTFLEFLIIVFSSWRRNMSWFWGWSHLVHGFMRVTWFVSSLLSSSAYSYMYSFNLSHSFSTSQPLVLAIGSSFGCSSLMTSSWCSTTTSLVPCLRPFWRRANQPTAAWVLSEAGRLIPVVGVVGIGGGGGGVVGFHVGAE